VNASGVTTRLRTRPLLAHDRRYLGLGWPALEWLERNTGPAMKTLETGSGASTVVFAASGASHLAISPSSDEHERVLRYCAEERIGTERLRFVAESSHTALARTWQPEPLDVVLIDGAHGFPFPILDWYYTAPHLRVGGRVLVDDAYQPSVNLLTKFLRLSQAWELEEVLGYRTVCFRKLDSSFLTFEWDDFALGRSSFDYLPPLPRLAAAVRHRVLDRSLLQRLLRRRAERRSGGAR
jgi:hypothetical protein